MWKRAASATNRTAPTDYLDPAAFFAKNCPTCGMKELLKAVCLRLSGKGGEVSSIIRLGTQYGGGKTHGLIALVHALRGAKGVPNLDRRIHGRFWGLNMPVDVVRLPFRDFDARATHVVASLPATVVRERKLLYDPRRIAP